jgi:hypothetical protein
MQAVGEDAPPCFLSAPEFLRAAGVLWEDRAPADDSGSGPSGGAPPLSWPPPLLADSDGWPLCAGRGAAAPVLDAVDAASPPGFSPLDPEVDAPPGFDRAAREAAPAAELRLGATAAGDVVAARGGLCFALNATGARGRGAWDARAPSPTAFCGYAWGTRDGAAVADSGRGGGERGGAPARPSHAGGDGRSGGCEGGGAAAGGYGAVRMLLAALHAAQAQELGVIGGGPSGKRGARATAAGGGAPEPIPSWAPDAPDALASMDPALRAELDAWWESFKGEYGAPGAGRTAWPPAPHRGDGRWETPAAAPAARGPRDTGSGAAPDAPGATDAANALASMGPALHAKLDAWWDSFQGDYGAPRARRGALPATQRGGGRNGCREKTAPAPAPVAAPAAPAAAVPRAPKDTAGGAAPDVSAAPDALASMDPGKRAELDAWWDSFEGDYGAPAGVARQPAARRGGGRGGRQQAPLATPALPAPRQRKF